MGLDMYLYAEKYISRNDYNAFDRNTMEFPPINPMFDAVIDATNSRTLVEPDSWTGICVNIPIGYWRKANAIHSYIVENHADGVDECQRIGLTAVDVRVLRDLCAEVLDHHNDGGSTAMAESVLPTRSGFFFGGLEYDEWYYQDIEKTIEICNRALNEPDCDNFIYQASW
jgi:hypothetical protein